MHLLDLGDTKEVVGVHRVEAADPQHHNVIEGVVLILVLQAVPVLGLVVVAVLLVPIVVVARDLEVLIEKEITVKIVWLMREGLDLYHLSEKMLNVVILVRLLVLVKRLGTDLKPRMVVLLLVLILSQGVQHAVLNLEVPHGIEHY